MISKRSLLLQLAMVAAVACDHTTEPSAPAPPPPPPPQSPGSASVWLNTPNTDDGAVIIKLQGPGLTTVQASDSSMQFYSRLVSESEAHIIVVGDLKSEAVFTFKVTDGKQVSAYTATLQQVAARNNSLRASLSGYTLTVAAVP